MAFNSKINFILILGSLLVFASVFPVFSSSQGCFHFGSHSLVQVAGGIPLIMFSSGVVLFAYLKKKSRRSSFLFCL